MTAAPAANGRIEIDRRVFNPYSKDFIRQPRATWQRLVKEFPVAYHKDLQMWMVNSHEYCSEMLKNNIFTPNYRVWENAPPAKAEEDKNDYDRVFDHSLFTVSTRDHLKLRKLTMPAFSRPVMGKIDGKIRDLVMECFDSIPADADEFDVYSTIAEKLPARSIARMVGVPTEMEEFFHEFAVNVVKSTRINLPVKQRDEAINGTLPGFKFFLDEIAKRRAADNPGTDFLGSLVSARDGSDQLDDYDIVSIILALITAGSDTATDLHTYVIHGLLSNPDQYQLLREQPELMENAIIELLRWGSFGKFPFFRFAAEDQDFHGQQIKKGQAVMINLPSAWHDPAKYPDWDKLDIRRNLEGNLVFGAGAHFCIGTYLVRVQGGLMLTEFMKRFPHAELANGDGEIDYDYNHHNARRITRLKVKTNRQAQRKAA